MQGLQAATYVRLATAQKFTDLIREDIIWCELCRFNLLHSFKDVMLWTRGVTV
jgi:hypothetical protein